MTRESVRDAVMGAIMMMILMSIGQQMGPEHQQAVQIKQLKTECEKFLPRNEHCKIVLVPTSKD